MNRFGGATIAAAVLALGIVVAPAASAGEPSTLRVERPVLRECAAELLPDGAAGAARRSWTAPASGMLTAAIEGDERPDWDLALFRNGEAAGASTAFGSVEQATIWVNPGDRVVAQACRRDGHRAEIPLSLDLYELAPTPDPERISMESVSISSPQDVKRLEQLGIDVTHDVSESAATVVLYSSAQRALLASAGFESRSLISDLPAADRADRRAELRAADARSGLPSTRDTYREYVDYTNEMKALADANPSLVREVTLGTSFEGRPIQGVEIATDVLRDDDGRPAYLNFGAHHAREWPSAEFPMEFARDLVTRYNASEARVVDLLDEVRVVIVPIVNVDGFLASRSYGFNALTDDDPNLTFGQSVANQAAYIRKNCNPTAPGDADIPCAQRTFSGVDLNRNYGYYWGGSGSSTDITAQSYRGTGPFSELEAQAVHDYSSSIHPTVFITNHTFLEDGKWLRQPGFDDVLSVTEDEAAMKALGDAMGDADTNPQLGATGWTSELGYETLGDITGATEDWNYFAQGTYGYTPEARGANFHANYQDMVVTEYLGDSFHAGEGVREAYLLAGEAAASTADHGIVQGTAPPGVTLRLRKQFSAPTSNPPGGPASVPEDLNTTLEVGAGGTYVWHINPSSRPDIDPGPGRDPALETWTMSCERPGQGPFPPVQVSVIRGQIVTQDWEGACGTDPPVNAPPVADITVSPLAPLVGQQVNFFDTSIDPDGAIATREWDLDDDGQFDDATGLVASRSFSTAGTYEVSLQVTDDDGGMDDLTRQIVVSNPPPPDVLPNLPQAGTVQGQRCASLKQKLKRAKSKERKRKLRGKLRKRGC